MHKATFSAFADQLKIAGQRRSEHDAAKSKRLVTASTMDPTQAGKIIAQESAMSFKKAIEDPHRKL